MKKRVISLFLVAVLTVTMLAACGSSSTGQNTGSTEAGTQENTAATTEGSNTEAVDSGKPDSWIADRTITIQAYVDDIGDTLPKDFNNTETMKKITELTGIKLDVRYTPGDHDVDVLASQLASGTIPDVIISYLDNSTRKEFPILYKAAKDGMFADVSEYMKNGKVYSKYYEDGYLMKDGHDNIVFREDFDGAVYLWQMNIDEIDRSLEWDPNEEFVGGMYIQTAIAEALDLDTKTIVTEDQLYDLLVKIKNGGFKDDNGNDVWPLGPKYWGGSYDAAKWITNGYLWGVSNEYNLDTDGKVKHVAETDYVYDQIGFIRKLLNEGLMNPEFFTMDTTRANEVSRNKNSAIIADVHNYEEIIYGSEDWIPLGPLNDLQGDNKEVVWGKKKRGCMAISADAKNPEEIFAFLDWLSTVEGQTIAQYGVEGISYDVVDGYPRLNAETLQKLNENDTDYLINNIGAAFGGTGNYFFEFVLTNKNNKDNFGESRPGASASEGSAYARSVKIATEYAHQKKLMPELKAPAFLSAPGLEDVKLQLDLLKWDETFIQACYAKSDAEMKTIVENFRTQLKAAGVEKFEEYVAKVNAEDPGVIEFYR